MNKDIMEKFAFDFPDIPENAHLFRSKIDWEAEEKKLEEEEKKTKKQYGINDKSDNNS